MASADEIREVDMLRLAHCSIFDRRRQCRKNFGGRRGYLIVTRPMLLRAAPLDESEKPGAGGQ